MKKSLLALAILGSFVGAASAQSTLTIFGVVDLSVNQIKNGSTKQTNMQSNQLNSNRLGFRGVEDLGGGMTASFWLEAGMANDDGTIGGSNGVTTAFFNRRSTVSLTSGFGELRLGRDYVASFWNTVFGDVNGANGLGQGLNMVSSLGSGAVTIARDNNMVGYFLPGNLGGVYGQFQLAAGEGVTGQKYAGGRLGYAAGPVDVSVAMGQTNTATSDKFKMSNIGGSYDFGMAKLYGFYNMNKYAARKQSVYELSVGVPLGQGEFRASYGKSDQSGAGTDGDDSTLYGLEYVYNLSKRTAMYTSYGRISNKGAAAFTVAAGAGSAKGATSSGFNVGLRHSF
jgi:predicted porin